MATVTLFNKRATAVGLKVQTGRGTVATVSMTTDALTLVGTPPTVTVDYLENNERDVTFGGMGNAGGQPGPAGKQVKITIVLEPKGLGVAPTGSTFPEIHPLMRISKHTATFTTTATFPGGITGASAWEYADSDTADEVGTLYAYADGKLIIAADCVATRKAGLIANKPGAETFEISGRFVSMAAASVPAVTISSVVPPIWNGNVATFGTGLSSTDATNSIIYLSAEIDEAISVAPLPSGGAVLDGSGATNVSGIVGHYITDRKPTLKLSLVQPALAVFDPFTEADNPNAAPVRKFTAALGAMASVGNRVVYQTGAVSAAVPATGDRNGVATYDLTGKIIFGTETTSSRSTFLRIG